MNNEVQSNKNRPSYFVVLATIFATLCTTIVVVLCLLYFGSNPSHKIAEWGQTGDFFGGILNPIFGFLSLMTLLVTLQQSEEEVHLSREQMKRSADALSAQANDSKQQTFERTFFELLRLYNEIVGAFAIKPRVLSPSFQALQQSPEFGRDVLSTYRNELRKRLTVWIPHFKEEDLNTISSVWLGFYKDKQHQLGHYFRSLYNILKFIDQSKLENKKFYADILRAQLSDAELVIIFYNANSDFGREKLLPLIEKYNLLKHLNKNDLTII